MSAHDHGQRTFRQAARHFNIPRRVRAMCAIIVMAHMGCGDDDIRFFGLLKFLNDQLRFFGGFTELDIGKEFRVADFGGVVCGQANNRNFQVLTFEQRPGFEQAFAGAFLVNIGRQKREFGPLFLLAQYGERVIKFVVSDCHRVITNQIHAAKVGFGVL